MVARPPLANKLVVGLGAMAVSIDMSQRVVFHGILCALRCLVFAHRPLSAWRPHGHLSCLRHWSCLFAFQLHDAVFIGQMTADVRIF